MTEKHYEIGHLPLDDIEQVLGATASPTRDVAHGPGHLLELGGGKAILEIFPGPPGVARVTTASARVELFRVPGYSITPARVVFEAADEHTRTSFVVLGNGTVGFDGLLRAPDGSAP